MPPPGGSEDRPDRHRAGESAARVRRISSHLAE